MTAKRNNVYDNVKCFLILCVVLGHLGNEYADVNRMVGFAQFWVYLFHMPAFVFISGLFSKRTVQENKWIKAVPYAFLYVLMKAMNTFLSMARGGHRPFDLLHEEGIPWFAIALLWWYLITMLVKKANPVAVLVIAVILAAGSGYVGAVGSFLAIQRTLLFFPFFYAGFVTDPEKLNNRLKRPGIRIFSLALLIGTVLVSYVFYDQISVWRILFRGINTYRNMGVGVSYIWGWSWRLAAYMISACMSLAIISVMPDIGGLPAKIGQKTLPIYVFHGVLIKLICRSEALAPIIERRISFNVLLLTAFITLFLALPVFDKIVQTIMLKKTGKQA